jgi:hypothetical protein
MNGMRFSTGLIPEIFDSFMAEKKKWGQSNEFIEEIFGVSTINKIL